MTGPLLVLVRHGQTESNVRKVLDTVPPGPPLTELGAAQAAALAQAMADEPVTAVYASTALRAQQTAAPLAARHRLEVGVLGGVHEVFVGELEGRGDHQALVEFEEVFAAWSEGDLARRLPGGESALDVRGRFLPAVDELWTRHAGVPDRVVVLVSHGAAIRVAAAALIGENAELRYLPNTGRAVLAPLAEPADPLGGWLLKSWDDAVPAPGDVPGGAEE